MEMIIGQRSNGKTHKYIKIMDILRNSDKQYLYVNRGSVNILRLYGVEMCNLYSVLRFHKCGIDDNALSYINVFLSNYTTGGIL